MRGLVWCCKFCDEQIVQTFTNEWTTEELKIAFMEKADSHIDFHVDLLMDELEVALGGKEPR